MSERKFTEQEFSKARAWLKRSDRRDVKQYMCAWYIDLGFTDAEIARILNLTTDDVQRLQVIHADDPNRPSRVHQGARQSY